MAADYPKISETLLHFMKPIIEFLGEPSSTEDLDALLQMGVAAWNAAILDEADQGPGFVAQIEERLAGQPEGRALFQMILARKRSREFVHDRRLIGDHEVYVAPDGEWWLRATAHAPPELRGQALP